MVELNQAIDRIAKLRENEIGPTEENVKQKVIVPILELLGHERKDLEFEYRTRSGGKLDIFIKNVPSDCKVIIDTKNYNENLSDYVEQIRDYTFDESSLLTLLANGTEIRIYSPLRGVAFERSMLYSIKRQDLNKASTWNTLSRLLQNENLTNRTVLKAIEEREQEIKAAMSEEERVIEECKKRIEGIEIDIESKEEEIEQLKNEREILAKEAENKIREVWKSLDLPLEVLRSPGAPPPNGKAPATATHGLVGKARKVNLQELVDAGVEGHDIPQGGPRVFLTCCSVER